MDLRQSQWCMALFMSIVVAFGSPVFGTSSDPLQLEAIPAKPDTIEALIDDLVNLSSPCGSGRPPDLRQAKLERLGFEAVPSLIAHWDDSRLTRCAFPPSMNFTGRPVFVSDVVHHLIESLAGDGLITDKGEIKKTDVVAWWAKAQQTGEEAYLLAHVLPAATQAEWPNEAMLRIITKKYPNHLPELYRIILEKRSQIQSADFIKAIGESSLPREVKRELFLQGANHPNLEHRRAALWGLKDLDPQRFLKVLIATLESLPVTPREPYWKCREAAFANLVMETDEPAAWSTLEKVAKRSDVGLRMEFMNPMNYIHIANRHRRQRLEFLAQFLDDDTVRDVKSNPKLFEGPHAAFDVAKIEVRNFAAWQIESILRMGVTPQKDWIPEQWAKLRDRVRQELPHELSRELQKAVR